MCCVQGQTDSVPPNRSRASSPTSRYQRFLEEELGQLLHSQGFEGQSQQQEGQPHQTDRRPQHVDGKHRHGSRQLQQSGSQGRVMSDSKTMSNWHTYRSGNMAAESCLTHQPLSHGPRGRRPVRSSETAAQPSLQHAMSAAESLQSAQRPKQQLSQPHDTVSTEAETALASETCQKPAGAQEPVAQEAEGPTRDAKGPTADAKGHPWGTKRPIEDMIQLSGHGLSGSRTVSPERRQLLLHSKFALFDSDSSSSEDEGNAQQVILALYRASLTLF